MNGTKAVVMAALAAAAAAALAANALRQPGSAAAAARRAGTCGPDRVLAPADPPMRGSDVTELQERLTQLGLYRGPLDGVYDAEVVAAVRRLQRARGSRPDGAVDARTWRLLAGPEPGAAPRGRKDPARPATARPQGPVTLHIDMYRQTLTVYVGGQPVRRYPVAIGKPATPSPPGEWRVIEKAFESGGAFGTRWLGLDVPWGQYGIHGTNRPWSIGTAASLGCFRMHNADVEELFDMVPVGTLVIVDGPLPDELWGTYARGSVGLPVVALQRRLRAAGFPPGRADARFGAATEAAVKGLQRFYGLPEDGVAGPTELYLLGLRRAPGGDAP